MKQLLVIIGMPGSGKDTQIEYLAKRRKFDVIRIGDLVRAKAKNNASIAADLDAGNLVNNTIVNDLVAEAINSAANKSYLISDGFPRDVEQAIWLDEFINSNNCEIENILLIDVNDDLAIKRLTHRGRDDDDSVTIQHRLDVFHTKTDKVIEYYQDRERISVVNGEGTPEEVADSIEKILGW